MQLQGELGAANQHTYRNIPQAIVQIAKNDGLSGLQKGLTPSLFFQFFLNAFRLGIYTTAHERGWTRNRTTGHVSILKSAFWGATGGFIGAAVSNPFFMVNFSYFVNEFLINVLFQLKTHLQSKAKKEIAVGFQHQHTGMFNALHTIFTQHGIRGLYRGVIVNLPRALLGSGGQLAAFGYTKDFLQRNYSQNLPPTVISFISGAVAGSVMAVTMTPPDVLATRLYNQGVTASGKGIYYTGVVDCFVKIVKSEGVMALYKGFWAHYIRIGPHSTLVLVFFDQLKALDAKYKSVKVEKVHGNQLKD